MQARARYHKGEHKSSPWSGPWVEVQARVMSQPSKGSSAAGTRNSVTPNSSAPATPNLAGAAVTPAGQVLLSWLNPSDDSITGYQVLRGLAADSLVVIEEDTGSSGTSYTDTAPPAGQTHTYAVKARNSTGLSPLSNTLTATVPAAEEEEEEQLITLQQSSDDTLVSTISTGNSTVRNLFAGSERGHAQAFMTGPNPHGYSLSSVRILLSTSNDDPSVTVDVRRGGNRPPDDSVYELTQEGQITRVSSSVTFRAPTGAQLLPSTKYWIVVQSVNSGVWETHNMTDEDHAEAGWDIIGRVNYYQTNVPWYSTIDRRTKMSMHGEAIPPILVSNLGQTTHSSSAQSLYGIAQTFVAGPGLAGFNYRFQGIRVLAHGFIKVGTANEVEQPQVRAGLHRDNGGRPGSLLHRLEVPPDFASTSTLAEYTLSASPGAVLRGGATYWIVLDVLNAKTLNAGTTSSTEEDQAPPPVDGWLIDNSRQSQNSSGVWIGFSRVIKLAVLGEPAWVTDEPAGEDFPGADFNAHETRGLVTPGTVSNGHMTAGVDRNYGQTGDYWYLDTQPGHSYRVEVTFGASPNNNTVGSAGVEFIDPDHDNYPDASGCCESDHNRDDGHTFVHFTHSRQSREWNTSYLLHVAAYDQLNTNSRIYNGPYTIQMTDITGTREFVSNLYQDTRTNLLEVGAARQYAMFFETGYNAAGYKLDRIQTFITHGGSPQFSLYSNTSNAPGTKLCDFRNPSKVQHHVVWSAGIPATTFLATDCAEITLMPTDSSGTLHTYYWIVMEGTNYRPSGMDSNGESAYEPGWRIGDLAVTKTTASWLGVGNSKSIPIGVWARERHNPLSVSQEVTSDPTRGMDSDTYGAGDVITFEVKFSEPVTITGAPRLRFKVSGAGDNYAPYVSGSGSDTLVFAYTVLATDADANGIFLYNRPLSYPDAAVDTIVAVDDNLPVFDNITGQLITLSGHKIDGTITN